MSDIFLYYMGDKELQCRSVRLFLTNEGRREGRVNESVGAQCLEPDKQRGRGGGHNVLPSYKEGG
jgi:hypothetical protein